MIIGTIMAVFMLVVARHYTLHIWMNSHIFPKHYNFHKISIDNGQVCWTNPYKKIKFYVL